MFSMTGKFSQADVYADQVEELCASQIQLMINHPSFTKPVRIMPDTHAGKGSVIGFTMEMGDSIIPNVVGVDIGCGVLFAKFPYGLLDSWDLFELDASMRGSVPFGHVLQEHIHYYDVFKDLLFAMATKQADTFTRKFNERYGTGYKAVRFDERELVKVSNKVGENFRNLQLSIGSVGGGNHYLEWGVDNTQAPWFSAHSGSRHFGLKIAMYHQKVAVEVMSGTRGEDYQKEILRIRRDYKGAEINKKIKELRSDLGIAGVVPKGMEFLKGQEMFDYCMDMILAQAYADVNRQAILQAVAEIMQVVPLRVHQTVHNYINFEDFVIRKGAISSYLQDLMIIPINMSYGSLLCTGKSNPDWNFSAPHGAGRLMSRRAAKDNLDMDVFKEQMQGIASTSVSKSTLDEAPGAYKDPEFIKESIGATASIVDRIIPVLNLKDSAGERG
jgi:tRNA-splicing ligase RtcB (3'-phosphate/5'-hydroxy nucleic acid ligase)